jgi:hypothetical protein
MNYERSTLAKLKMRFTHTSNKDVALVENSRVPNEGKKRIEYEGEEPQRKPRNKNSYENY